jgi:polyisoprenoid-binding protein YceI
MKRFLLAVGLMVAAGLGLQAAPETYAIDAVHSSVDFKIRHLGISWVQGSFGKFDGKVVFDAEKPEASSVEITVQADSVDTRSEARDKHLKNEDFFNVSKYPTLTFKSIKVEKKGENTYEVTGDFTMLGVTKPLTFTMTTSGPVEGMKKETRRGGETEFTIKRSDFGMKTSIGPIGDEVKVSLAFSGVKQ